MPCPLDALLGRLVAERGLITPDQLAAALRRQEADATRPPLGVVLVEAGLLTHEQVDQLLEIQAATAAGGVAARGDPHAPEQAASWRFGALAVRRARATPDQVNRALREQARREEAGEPWTPLGEVLVQQGALDASQARDILRLQASETTLPAGAEVPPTPPSSSPATVRARPDSPSAPVPTLACHRDRAAAPTVLQPSGQAHTPQVAAAESTAPRRRFGRYELVAELGRGGMGVVYKAWHPGLKAYFAVKVLLAGQDASNEDVQRFHREAQAAARLKHPGILAVHDIGVEDGKTYFAMEYVEGASLDQVLANPVQFALAPGRSGGLNVAAAVRMAREIAEALHAAHEAGVVHRDLKPANVLRDASGRLKVMDFGLARVVDAGATAAAGATRTGTLMGTPAYMSPEQARGDVRNVDARSDVYQIGALLYELLTGHPPYEGKDALDVVMKVVNEDPRPPRRWDPALDRDAETICVKAMAREKAQRYASARDLAEDCRRFLAGEAIRARPPAWWERPMRWARRRKALVGLGAAAAVALAVAGGLAWRTHAALQEVLENVRTIAATNLESTLMVRRAGGRMAEVEQKLLPPVEAAVQRALERAPHLVEPRYHLGRMYRALMRFAAARKAQEEALAQDPDYGPSLYECGVLLAQEARLLREEKRAELLRLRASGMEKGHTTSGLATDADVEKEYPEVAGLVHRALANLTRAAGLGDTQPGMKARARAARAIAAALAGSADSERLLSEALTDDARLEEVRTALAGCAVVRGDWEEAARRLEEGWKVDLGYVPHVVALGETLYRAAEAAEERGRDGGDFREHARRALEEALGRDPAQAELWEVLATLRRAQGEALQARAQDPTTEYQGALAALDKALALGLTSAKAATNLALVYQSVGDVKRARREDPTDAYLKALAGYDRALALDPKYAAAANNQANVYASLGEAKRARGQDATDEYRKALAGYDRVLALNPNHALAANNQAAVYRSLGDAKRARGADPTDEYRQALAGCERALAINPSCALAAHGQANAYQSLGDAKRDRGADPTDDYRKALAGYDRALALNPGNAVAVHDRALLSKLLGDAKRARGQDPTEEYREALAGYDRALALNPNLAEAAYNLANVYRLLGDEKRDRGADPTDEYRRALAGYDRAQALDPGDPDAAINQALLYQSLGDAKRARGAEPTDEYRKALASYDRGLRINPRLWQAHANCGRILESLGESAAAVRAYEAALAAGGAAAAAVGRDLARARAAAAATAAPLPRSSPQRAEGETPPASPPAAPPAWLACAARAARAIATGDYAAARPLYEEALAAAGASAPPDAAADPAVRTALLDAHYNLACILALAAAGRDGPMAAPKPPLPRAEAARLRDAAFEHLHAALARGWTDRGHLEKDPDLAPLHDDSRWTELLGELPDSWPK